jgi:hypothetical protein
MHSVRALAVAGLAALSLSCADDSVGTRGGVRLASLSIAPVFATTPSGGPKIDIETIRGVLRRASSTDSSVASASVEGDSAILEFADVRVTGDSTKFTLGVKALDANNVVVFEGTQEVSVKPGNNSPASPTLQYTAPDATVASIDIQQGTTSVSNVALQWLGAIPGNTACLNRVPNAAAVTQVQLSISGKNAANQAVPNVRVGWTSLDPTTATVDDNGLVVARCSNKSTKVIARTFLDKADTVDINVTAPPFTLLMSPEVADLRRGSTLQMQALVVDENNNSTATTAVTWNSSDTQRATVSATGLVTAVANGRVVITASTADRTTVGILQVIRPLANRVVASPDVASINVNQRAIFGAVAFDASNQRIMDASGFTWSSTNAGIASVTSSGSVLGVAAGSASIIVSLDGKADTVPVTVTNSTTGNVAGRIVDGGTGAALSTATITNTTNPTGADGRFTTNQMNPSPAPSIQITRTGYVTFQYFNLPFQVGTTSELGDLPMAPAGGTGTLTGTVVNAVTDGAVAGATVRLFNDITPNASLPNCTTGCTPLMQTTTTAGGGFTFASVPAGTYTYTVTASGFSFTRRVTVALSAQTRDTRIVLSPAPTGAALRIVLSWGDCANPSVPCDLDSHMTGPASAPDTGRFHVAFYQRSYFSSPDSVAVLDNDAVNGLGPETVTLRQKAAGVYKYYVHNFTDRLDTASTRLSTTAQARVEVYQGTNLLGTFLPPSGQQGTIWAVFQIEGSTIIPVNQMLKIQDFTQVPGDFMVIRDPDVERLMQDVRGRIKKK